MRQRGLTLIGLLFWAVIVAFIALVGARVTPTVIEYFTIQRAINKLVNESTTSSVPEIRRAFDRQRDVEYGIESVKGEDLDITKEGDTVVIGFAYEKEVPVAGPVFLLIKYEGRSR